MSRAIIKIKDKYFEWSTIVDGPVTYGMDKEELKSYIKAEYGRSGLQKLPRRLLRVEETGSSFHHYDLEATIKPNRAGENEEELTEEEIYEKFKEADKDE